MRVGVAGALGRLGRVACTALAAADGITLVAAFARSGAGELLEAHVGAGGEARIFDDLEAFYAVGMDVVVDCTVQPVTLDVARLAIANGVSPVIGATGWSDADVAAFAAHCTQARVPAMIIATIASICLRRSSSGANWERRSAAKGMSMIGAISGVYCSGSSLTCESVVSSSNRRRCGSTSSPPKRSRPHSTIGCRGVFCNSCEALHSIHVCGVSRKRR